jgi:hypothetical protein
MLYDYGLDEWRTWSTGDFRWMALQSSYTPSKAHQFVSTVVASECSAAGYARDTVTGATRTVDTGAHKITYDCDNPDLGTPAAGQTVGYVALFKYGTGDADSILLALFDIVDFATDGGALTPVVSASGVHWVDQA